MLPHNHPDEPDVQQARRYRTLIYISIMLFTIYTFNQSYSQKMQNDKYHLLCPSLDYDLEILSFLLNEPRQTTNECYIYYLFKELGNKNLKGVHNGTYSYLAFSREIYDVGWDISVRFSESLYLDDQQYIAHFLIRYDALVNSLENNTTIKLQQSTDLAQGNIYDGLTSQKYNQTLTMEITNVTKPDVKFIDQVIFNIKLELEQEGETNLINLQGQVEDYTYETEIETIIYSFLNSVVTIICIVSGLLILRRIIEFDENADEYSIMMVGFMMIQDFYLCFLNFFYAMLSDTYFQYFITPSFLQFIMFSIFEMRLIMIIWKQRLNLDINNFRNQVIKFYCGLYFSIFVIGFIVYQYLAYPIVTFLMSFYLIPQIIHTAIRGQQVRIKISLLMTFVLPRYIIFFYFRFYPQNILNLRPMPILCIFIFISIISQFAIYYFQWKWGPQFIIPKCFLPKKYNYFIKIPEQFDLEYGAPTEFQYLFQEECSICMGPLHQQPIDKLSQEEESNYQIKQILQKHSGNIMKTPCEHKFHLICLVKWMSIKLSCPSCRSVLPPL